MRERGNEARVCDLIMRYLEERCGLQAENIHTTENDGESDPTSRVDRRFRIGFVSYALEHTILEPYEDEMRHWAQRKNLRTVGGREYRELPHDFDESSFRRLLTAFNSKREKLKQCQSEGMRTALVLESKHIVIDSTHYALMMDRVPEISLVGLDSVYLVETGDQRVWYGWLLMSDGLFMRPALDGRWPDPVIEKRQGD